MKNISSYTLLLKINLEPIYDILIVYFFFGSAEKIGLSFYIAILMMLSAIFQPMGQEKDRA